MWQHRCQTPDSHSPQVGKSYAIFKPTTLPLEIAIPDMRFSLAVLAILCGYSSAISQEIRVPHLPFIHRPLRTMRIAPASRSVEVSRDGATRARLFDGTESSRSREKYRPRWSFRCQKATPRPPIANRQSTRDAMAKATGNGIAIADFGVFQIAGVGYQGIELQSQNSPEVPPGTFRR